MNGAGDKHEKTNRHEPALVDLGLRRRVHKGDLRVDGVLGQIQLQELRLIAGVLAVNVPARLDVEHAGLEVVAYSSK